MGMMLNPIIPRKQQFRCSAFHLVTRVNPNGIDTPFQNFNTGLGNIINDRWENIWNNLLSKKLRENIGVSDYCEECSLFDPCIGDRHLSYYREEYLCPESQAND